MPTCKCGVVVIKGENGSITQAPWEDTASVECYACENRREDAAAWLESDTFNSEFISLWEEQ